MNRKARRLAQKQTNKKGRGKQLKVSEEGIRQRFSEAVQAFQSGDTSRATVLVNVLIKQLPPEADLFKLRGSIEFSQQNYPAAIENFRAGLEVNPSDSSLCDFLGTAQLEQGAFGDAIVSLRRALLNDGQNPGTLNNLGLALFQTGELDKAATAFRDSLIYRPKDKSTLLNLARVLQRQEVFDGSVEIYQNLLTDDPKDVEVYQALGECQMNARDWPGALQTAEIALGQGIVDAEIYTLKGYALGALLDFTNAEKALLQALDIEPDRASAESALSILSFYQEKWSNGWRYYEARQRNPVFGNRPFPQQRWVGEDLTDKRILLWGEQGVGDEIMFGTMLPDFLKSAPAVTFEMDPRLVPLFSRSFPVMNCVPRSDRPSKELMDKGIDFQLPSGSLGQYLRPNSQSFGSGEAYLVADPQKVKKLRQTYGAAGKKLNVGLAWYSSNGRGLSKSISLSTLEPLFQVPEIQFFDLQYGDHLDERVAFEREFGHLLIHDETIDQMESLDDFAAQIAAMDLVISISNSTVHVAGALGVPTWILLPAAPMERWLLDRTDSPWYASVELFRQRHDDDLEDTVGRVRDRLVQFNR